MLRAWICVVAAIAPAVSAGQDLAQAVQANPRDPKAHGEYAIFLQQQGRTAEAIAHFRTALDLDPKSPLSSYNLALALLGSERPAEALEVLDKYPFRNGDWYALRGTVLNTLGRQADAIADLKRGTTLDPSNPDTLYDLIITLLRTEANAEAAKFIETGRMRFPKVGKIHAAAGALAYATGKNDQAARAYETAVRLEPAAADFHAALADVYDAVGDLARAEAAYRKALEIDGTAAAVYVKFGKNQLKRQQPVAAEAAFRNALGFDASDAEAHFQMGKIEAGRGDHAAAIDHWEKAVAANPGLKEAWYQLSLSYRRSGQPEKAARAAEQFKKLP